MHRALILAAVVLTSGGVSGDPTPAGARLQAQLTLWAWERPEDLRFLAGRPVRVAYLERTIQFDAGRMSIHYRQQPLRVSPDTPLMSVVRVETRGSAPAPSLADSTAALIVRAVHAPEVTALQIDFDARRSDRPFYGALLKSVRAALPREIPLSMTALASWCIDDPWIDERDVDEVVPMVFQMGPDAKRVLTRLDEEGHWPIDACNGAAGLATDERHHRRPPARSVYLFNPRAWTAGDLRALPGN